ncbi:MAG TPA: MnhB domain-containing protein [Aggregatilineales bacterium]|nr:Na(+)/H(+) antiporter subunit B [Anaerolineales bacterium]HRE46676.1 MnhB domain-containing protein [Aggregatilineales bacterium]
MIDSMFLRFMARVMTPVLLLFSFYFMLRGHNEPGGGFIGGLVAASAIVLLALAFGAKTTRERIQIDFLRTMFFGVGIAAIAGLLGLIFRGTFLTALWQKPEIPSLGKLELGTPALFDFGVYITVIGVTSAIVLAMAEEGEKPWTPEDDDPPQPPVSGYPLDQGKRKDGK